MSKASFLLFQIIHVMYSANNLFLELHQWVYLTLFILESVYLPWYAVITGFTDIIWLISITGDDYLLVSCGQSVRYGHADLDSPQQEGWAYHQNYIILALKYRW